MALLTQQRTSAAAGMQARPRRPSSALTLRNGGLWAVLLSWVMAMGHPSDLRTQTPPPGEYEVKAAFLYNFAKFVEWPPSAFADSNSPLIIGVLGDDPFGEMLDRTVDGKLVQGRLLRVERWKRPGEIRNCHILFISTSERGALPQILNKLQAAPVLTVSEEDAFEEHGGMIRFLLGENKVRFAINNRSARNAGLKISSRLLGLAVSVWD